jgi:hypothetical protein
MTISGGEDVPGEYPALLRKRARKVAMAFTMGMREALSKYEIDNLPDFVEAMVVTGLLFERRFQQEPVAASTDFARRVFYRIPSIAQDAKDLGWEEEVEALIVGPVRKGVRLAGRRGPLSRARFIEAAIAADSVAAALAREHDLTAIEAKNLCAQAIAFSGYALSDPDGDEEIYESLQALVTTHIKAWALTLH